MVQDSNGDLYGTVWGNYAFKFTLDGVLTTLHGFCRQENCADGLYPNGLNQATSGIFYGTTYSGGENYQGTAFALDVGLRPFVTFVRPAGRVGQTGGILGQGFSGTSNVSLNELSAAFTVISDTYIKATVPPGATSGYVTVTTPSGTLTSNKPFIVLP